ncbi:MAG: GPW/gp25 family protein [Burkholderiaceae bacterium]
MSTLIPTSSQFFSPAISTMAVSAHAQALGLNDNLSGSLVTDVDDINQCIHIILHTPKSADPLRPTFGCDQDKYLDSPINIARPHLVREITDALRQWEPRIVVTRVSVELVDIAQLAVSIYWRFADDVLANYVTNLTLDSARVAA